MATTNANGDPDGNPDGDAGAHVARIRQGYAFDGAAISLGAAVIDGTAHPGAQVRLPLGMMNRHGLVAGATGTGKTVTLQVMAEQLSSHGVPVFLADIKGDLTGLSTPGTSSEKLAARVSDVGQDWSPEAFPVEYYALGGDGSGIPLRATISSFGPILLARVLELNETQESSLQLVFHYADRSELELYNLADLRAVITYLTSAAGKTALAELGGLSKATAGVILRKLVALEAQGLDRFFGEPEFDTADLLRNAPDGRGMISCLELPTLQSRPQLFSTFLMWLVADLFAELPEAGDLDKPKLVFFLDEAHLLFRDASKAFLDSIAATVRLIRSKGIGVFFVTQTPRDVPAEVLGQLSNRIQHALRAFTPDDAKALRSTVSTFPVSDYDLEEVLTTAGIGEAVVTVMDERGSPTPVAWTRMAAPRSKIGPSATGVVERAIVGSTLLARYGSAQDSPSAFEKLSITPASAPRGTDAPMDIDAEARRIEEEILGRPASPPAPRGRKQPSPRQSPAPVPAPEGDGALFDFAREAAAAFGAELARGLFGTRRRRRR